MKIRYWIALFGFLVLGYSFKPKLMKKDILRIVKQYNLYKTHSKSDITWQWTYYPTELLFYHKIDALEQEKDKKELINTYNDYAYFMLDLSYGNKDYLNHAPSAKANYGQTLENLSFNVADWLYLINESNDTIPLINHQYVRSYGMSKSNRILCTYSKTELESSKELHLFIKDFGTGIGEVQLTGQVKNIKQLPQFN